MEFSDNERLSLQRLLRWRRDVRHFRTDPVPEALLDTLKEAMSLAPSVGNARPWRVLRVENAGLRQAVQALHDRANAQALAAQPDARKPKYQQLKLHGLDAAPLQLAVFTETAPDAGHGLGRHSMPQTLEQSTAMAIQNLNLIAVCTGWAWACCRSLTRRQWKHCSRRLPHGASASIYALAGHSSMMTSRCCIARGGRKTRERRGRRDKAIGALSLPPGLTMDGLKPCTPQCIS